MKPTVEAYTVALPWYQRADFQRLWELAHDKDDMPSDYDVWHAAALKVINQWLARGRAIQIVMIRPDEFLAWLDAQGLPNTAAIRLKYVEQRAANDGSGTSGLGLAAEARAHRGASSQA